MSPQQISGGRSQGFPWLPRGRSPPKFWNKIPQGGAAQNAARRILLVRWVTVKSCWFLDGSKIVSIDNDPKKNGFIYIYIYIYIAVPVRLQEDEFGGTQKAANGKITSDNHSRYNRKYQMLGGIW